MAREVTLNPASHAPQLGVWVVLSRPVLSTGWLWDSLARRSFATFPSCNARAKVPTERARGLLSRAVEVTPQKSPPSQYAQGSLLAVV